MSQLAQLKEQTVKELRGLLESSTTQGVDLRTLERDYQTICAASLSSRTRALGYVHVEDFIKDLHDQHFVKIEWRIGLMKIFPAKNEATKHLTALVNRQRTPKKKKKDTVRLASVPHQPSKPSLPHNVRESILLLLDSHCGGRGVTMSEFSDAFWGRYGNRLTVTKFGFSSSREALVSLVEEHLVEIRSGQAASGTDDLFSLRREGRSQAAAMSVRAAQRGLPPSPPAPAAVAASPPVSSQPEMIAHNIKKVMAKVGPDGMDANDFVDMYRTEVGSSLSCLHTGRSSIMELLASMPTVLRLECNRETGGYLVFSPGAGSSTAMSDKDTKRCNTTSATSNVKVNKSSLVSTAPPITTELQETLAEILDVSGGIYVKEFVARFKQFTGRNLSVTDLGFTTLESFLAAQHHILTIENPDTSYAKAVAVNNDASSRTVRQVERTHLVVNPRSELGAGHCGVPFDSIGPGVSISSVQLPPAPCYILVHVSDISSPQSFYMQLHGNETTNALEELMDHLDDFYNGPTSTSYEVPDGLLMIGQTCVAPYTDNNWHRVVITGLPKVHRVQVYFVDYGTTSCVERSSLRLLRRSFVQLPAQAIPACLANIRPPAPKKYWSKEATEVMLDLCRHRQLYAYLTGSMDETGIRHSVCLTDTSTDVDVHINDSLVYLGHASFASSASTLAQLEPVMPDVVPTTPHDVSHSDLHDVSHSDLHDESHSDEQSDVTQMHTSSFIMSDRSMLVCRVERVPLHVSGDDGQPLYVCLVLCNGKTYVSSGELCSYLSWHTDTLKTALRQRRSVHSHIVVTGDDGGLLIDELHRRGVPHYNKSARRKMPSGDASVILYELDSVPILLQELGCKDSSLLNALQCLQSYIFPNASTLVSVDSSTPSFPPSNGLSNLTNDDALSHLFDHKLRNFRHEGAHPLLDIATSALGDPVVAKPFGRGSNCMQSQANGAVHRLTQPVGILPVIGRGRGLPLTLF